MTELSQIEKDGVVYDLKDTAARKAVAQRIARPTMATVGDYLRVLEVDEHGIPTKWETAPIVPGDTWELIVDHTVEENCGYLSFTTDINGNTFDLKKALLYVIHYAAVNDDGTVNGQPLKALFSTFGAFQTGLRCHHHGLVTTNNTATVDSDGNPLPIPLVAMVEVIGESVRPTMNLVSYNSSSVREQITQTGWLRDQAVLRDVKPTTTDINEMLNAGIDKINGLHIGGIYNSVGKNTIIRMYGVRK